MNPSQFPNQRLTTAEKIKQYGSVEKWGQAQVDSILNLTGYFHYSNRNRRYNKQVNYNLYHGILTKDDYKYVTEPYGVTDFEFPATLQHYDLVSPKINLLKGEEMKRPFSYMVAAVNEDVTSEIQKKERDAIVDVIMQEIQMQMNMQGIGNAGPMPDQAMPPEQAQQMQAEQQQAMEQKLAEVQKYYKYEYKDIREIAAQNVLDYLMKYLTLRDKFNDGWLDLLITGEEVYWMGVHNNEPVFRTVNPLYFEYDLSPDIQYIEDAAWAMEMRYLTASEVYDEYFEFLNEDQIEKIEQIKGGYAGRLVTDAGLAVPLVYETGNPVSGFARNNSNTLVKVVHFEWKSLRKIGFLTYLDEMGMEQETIVDENYKPSKGEKVEWSWINEVWEATKIAEDIYVGIRPKPNQHRNMDYLGECKLGYVGIAFNNRNSKPYSLVEVMKPIQYLYNIIMYRLELEIARAKGKKMIFDIAQVPRSQGWNIEKWMYYFDTLGIAFINSFEEGRGKFAGQLPTFNQFTHIDLSLGQTINQYVMILDKLEMMLGDISGVTKQRQGQISTSELVGNVERSVVQSSHITEHLFDKHNEVKRRCMQTLLEVSKTAWMEGCKKLAYIADDMTRVFFEVDGNKFNDAEYGVFVTNTIRENQILETVKQLAQQALSSQQITLMDVVSVLQANSAAEAKKVLAESIDRQAQMMQEQSQMQQEQQMQLQQQMLEDKERDREMKKYEIDENNRTKIEVATLSAMGWDKGEDIDNNGVPDILEIEKFKHEAQKAAIELGLKDKEIGMQANENEKQRQHERSMKDKDVQLKREEMQSKEKIAKMKPKPSSSTKKK